MDRKFDAFISYRHSELDMYIAKNLEKKLETFKLPKGLKDKASREKIERVFRDQDELPIASDLSNQIMAALEVTDFLIVICTPRLPKSKWCLSEISNFIRMHGKDHVLAVLAEGEPEESFPDELVLEQIETVNEAGETVIETVRIEPLAADVRGKNKREINKKLDDASMRLAAAIFGVNYDDLKQRHKEREMRSKMTKMTIAAFVFMAFAVVSTIFMFNLASKNQEIMDQNARITVQNEQIISQSEEIEKQKEEIEEQYIDAQKKYTETMAKTAEDLIGTGRKKEALYALLSVMPESSEDEMYSTECHRVLNKCMEKITSRNSFSITGSIEMEAGTRKMKVAPGGKYAIALDESGKLIVIDTDTAEVVDSLDSTLSSIIRFIDEDHFVYLNDEYKGCIYSIASKEIIEVGASNIDGVCFSPEGSQYCISSATALYLFTYGEYSYNSYTNYTNRFYEDTIYSCQFIDETILAIATFNFNEKVVTVYLYDTENEEVISKSELKNMGTPQKILVSQDNFYVICNEADAYNYQIVKYDKSGKKIKSVITAVKNDSYIYETQMGFDTSGNIVFASKISANCFNPDTLEVIPEYSFDINESEDAIGVEFWSGNNGVFITYKNGDVIYYTRSGNQQDCCFINSKYDRDISKSIIENGVMLQTLSGEKNLIVRKIEREVEFELVMQSSSPCISRNGKYMMTKVFTTDESVVKFMDSETGTTVQRYPEATKFGFIGEGDSFYIITDKCEVYSSETQELLFTIDPEKYDKSASNLVTFGKDGEVLYFYDFADSKKEYTVISLKDGKIIGKASTGFESEGKWTSTFILSEDGSYFGFYDDRNEIRVYHMGDETPYQQIPVSVKAIKNINFSSDNKYLSILYIDNRMEIYNLDNLELVKSLYEIEITGGYFEYIKELDKYLLYYYNQAYLLNKDLEIEASLNYIDGYGEKTGFMVSDNSIIVKTPYPKYEDLVKEAREYLGDFTPSGEIKKRFKIGE